MSGGRVVTLDTSNTQLATDKTAIAADGVEVCTVYVTAKNTDNTNGEANPMSGLRASAVVLAVTPSTGVTLTQPTGIASTSGAVSGSFVSTNATTVSVTATVLGVAQGSPTTVIVGGGGPTPPTPGDPDFEEDFTGLAFNNANGFTWGTQKNTTVVSYDGFNALRYRYSGGGGGSQNAEQRFNMGQEVRSVWIEFDMHIPSNFTHPDVAPSNNKWLQMWRDIYSDSTNGTLQHGYEFQRAGATSSNIRVVSSRTNFNSPTSSNATGDYLPTGQNALFISGAGPLTIGAWNQVRMQYTIASDATTADGIQRMWINGTKFVEITTGKFWNFETGTTPTDCFMRNGYFMGSANALYTTQTDFHQKAVKFWFNDNDPGWT
jgi:hypothetical protein